MCIWIYPELLLRLPPGSLNVGYREHSVAVEKNAVWHTLTTPLELDWLKRSPINVHPPQASLLIQRRDRESLAQLSWTVKHCLCSSQGKDLKLFIFWIKEPLQPVRVREICEVSVNTWKGKWKKTLKFIFTNWIFGIYFLQRISSSFTRSKVKGIHADHVRGLTVY